jgi:hypothetical protein
MLDRTEQLLSGPEATNPRVALANVLRSAAELLSSPDNDFAWSSWANQAAAVAEVEALLALVEAGELPDRTSISVLFAPTGPIQEVSLNSGWADVFMSLAERYERAAVVLWP